MCQRHFICLITYDCLRKESRSSKGGMGPPQGRSHALEIQRSHVLLPQRDPLRMAHHGR